MNAPIQTPSAASLLRLGAAVPRYTSYPTAPHFHDGIDRHRYCRWLSQIREGEPVSLYIHVPFCDRLCWFCGCHTKHTLKYEPVEAYLRVVEREIDLVTAAIGKRVELRELHLGGGSPSLVRACDMASIAQRLCAAFDMSDQSRISVEIDPSDLDAGDCSGLEALGMNRASIGVQDFEPVVQKAINRIQTFEDTARVAEALRRAGARSLNMDALYGLPHQSVATVLKTLEQVVSLKPDRIALFGYAHVPWMKTHQRMIDEAALPGIEERFEQASEAGDFLVKCGYQRIGIDHFALPTDSLAIAATQGRLRRNFQGYTDDPCEVLLGLGGSSIGRLPQGHVQNITATGNYVAAVNKGELPIAKGIAFTDEDRTRARVIEMVMCNFAIDTAVLRKEFGVEAETVISEAGRLADEDRDGLLVKSGDNFVMPEASRPFARTVAAKFDTYLDSGKARHSSGV
ncbi:MAG: oxygen-independent coproporphyrinogen III oxidase [Nitratireductor sp.]